MNKRTEETPLNDRDAYLFIIDVDKSLVVSNPRYLERAGGNIREHLDWSGKHYGVELCEVAMRGAAPADSNEYLGVD